MNEICAAAHAAASATPTRAETPLTTLQKYPTPFRVAARGNDGQTLELADTSGDPLRGGHLRALDGLRGVALLTVFLHHLGYNYSPQDFVHDEFASRLLRLLFLHGWLGVDIFFVLSGFLITTVLLRSRRAENYYSVFYKRRFLRIAPVYYAVLLVIFVLPWPPLTQSHHLGWEWQRWWWLCCSNVITGLHPSALYLASPFWSLAVEEHFYLLWPVLVRKLTATRLLTVALVLAAAEPVLRVLPPVLRLTHRFPEAIYRWTPFHCDGLLLGAALALAISTGRLSRGSLPLLRAGALLFTLVAATMLYAGFRFYTTPVIALAAACAVGVLTFQDGRGAGSAFLSLAPLRLVGRYSYFMYSTQTLVISLCAGHLVPHIHMRSGPLQLLVAFGLPVLLSFSVAALSWKFFEQPINALKRYLPYRVPMRPEGTAAPAHADLPDTATLAA